MTSLADLPLKCRDCAKSDGSFVHRNCRACRDLGFDETVLCDLNRCLQEPDEFQCHAFQPRLRTAGLPASDFPKTRAIPAAGPRKEWVQRLLRSDRIKYERALALQRLERDPDRIFLSLKYHMAWNVIERRSAFAAAKEYIGFFFDAFSECSDISGGFVSLSWLAPDHVHVYVESDGNRSMEEVARGIKRTTEEAILNRFPDLPSRILPGGKVWDEAYFVETVP